MRRVLVPSCFGRFLVSSWSCWATGILRVNYRKGRREKENFQTINSLVECDFGTDDVRRRRG